MICKWGGEEDFRYERSGTASDKKYFSKFLDEVWEQLIHIGRRGVLGGRLCQSILWGTSVHQTFKADKKTLRLEQGEVRVLGDEIIEAVT